VNSEALISMSFACVAFVACGGSRRDSGVQADSTSPRAGALGLNDVSILLRLPDDVATPTLLGMSEGGTDLVPRMLFAQLVAAPGDVLNMFEEFQLVAIRFDLCDRQLAGACPAGSEGRLRLVFQPLSSPPTMAPDVALHAFYPIPADQMADVVGELRALAALRAIDPNAPLSVAPALTLEYAARLRALLVRYAAADRLLRLTLLALKAPSQALNWAFRGMELQGGTFAAIPIADVAATEQVATLVSDDPSYDVSPVADQPTGFAMALSSSAFDGADPTTQLQALGALAAVQNPQLYTAQNAQCVACHVATYLTQHRAQVAGVDPATLPDWYRSSSDLWVAPRTERTLRGFGWLGSTPAISQRVANDSAEVLAEIAVQFPAPR
jgi:hypothetical protein